MNGHSFEMTWQMRPDLAVMWVETHLLAQVGEGATHVGEGRVIYDVPVEDVKLVHGHGFLLGLKTNLFLNTHEWGRIDGWMQEH